MKHNIQSVIEKSIAVHGNLYDYSKVQFTNVDTPVVIIDPEYGEFMMRLRAHMNGRGHKKRRKKSVIKVRNTEDFVREASIRHNFLYDYTKVEYTGAVNKICIIDPEYGEFLQTPAAHLSGQGHRKRGRVKATESMSLKYEDFEKRAREVHGNVYDYSKVVCKNGHTKVTIIHPTLGEFEQTPSSHMQGAGHPGIPRQFLFDKDHIIPISIVLSRINPDSFERGRPLVKFLNSAINIRLIESQKNRSKGDLIIYRGHTVKASVVKNQYDIIHEVVLQTLDIDIIDIIDADKKYINDYFGFGDI